MSLRRSVRYAIAGLRYVYVHERNFRIHVVIALIALIMAITLQASAVQWLFIITAVASVFALEIVNTVFEKVVDMFHPRVHEYAGIIKDLMAAAVVVASLSALIVGASIFIPLILLRFF